MCAFIFMELLSITRQIHCKAVEQRATLIHRQYNRDWGTSYSRPLIDTYLTFPLLQNPGGATGCNLPVGGFLAEREMLESVVQRRAGAEVGGCGGRVGGGPCRQQVHLITCPRTCAHLLRSLTCSDATSRRHHRLPAGPAQQKTVSREE